MNKWNWSHLSTVLQMEPEPEPEAMNKLTNLNEKWYVYQDCLSAIVF